MRGAEILAPQYLQENFFLLDRRTVEQEQIHLLFYCSPVYFSNPFLLLSDSLKIYCSPVLLSKFYFLLFSCRNF